jgi:hypothetical protein
MEHVRSENLGSSTNHHIEPTSYTDYLNWYNDEELVEMPSEKEQQTQRTLTAQKMGVKAHEAARLASCIETQEEAPSMSLEELIQEFERVRIIKERVEKNLREAEEREKAYARNRRTSPFLGAIITNAAIA